MRHQSGTTLISLLIGLLIAMLCLMGVLSSYRTIVKTGVTSRIAATHDTELQNGLTISQMLVQNAGFRLEGGDNVLIAPITVGSDNVSALLWRYKEEDGTVVCQGLADIASSDSTKRDFIILKSATCDSSATLNGLAWTKASTLAHLVDYTTDSSNPPQVTFEKTASTCSPFGAAVSDNVVVHPIVTISAKTSTQSIAELASIQIPVCLLNITS